MTGYELLTTAGRAVAVCALLLALLRVMGRRSLGTFTAFDLLVALIIGSVIDEMIYGRVSFVHGTVAVGALAAAAYATSWLTYWRHGFGRVVEGTPTVVVEHGNLRAAGLRRERLAERDLMAALRKHGISDIREVKLAVVEEDGSVSVIREDWAEPVRRGDVSHEYARRKVYATGGRELPPEDKQTDSRQALA